MSVCGFGYPLREQVATRPHTLKMRSFFNVRMDTYLNPTINRGECAPASRQAMLMVVEVGLVKPKLSVTVALRIRPMPLASLPRQICPVYVPK